MNAGSRVRLYSMALAVLLFGLTASVAQAQLLDPPYVQILLPEGTSGFVRLQPGESGVLTYAVKNMRTTALGTLTIPVQLTGIGGNYDYLFEAEPGSRCNLTVNPLALTVSGLALGETLICRTGVTRAPTSLSDLKIGFCTFGNCNTPFLFSDLLFAGTLPDMALASTFAATPIGASTALVRLTASNAGSRAIPTQLVETQCLTIGGVGPVPLSPFVIENNFASACPTVAIPQRCINVYGQDVIIHGYSIGPIPAGGSASCELRLRFRQPLTAPVSIAMSLPSRTFTNPDGTVEFDPDVTNNTTRIGAAPAAAYEYVPVPALGRDALLLLAGLLVAAAAWRYRPTVERR